MRRQDKAERDERRDEIARRKQEEEWRVHDETRRSREREEEREREREEAEVVGKYTLMGRLVEVMSALFQDEAKKKNVITYSECCFSQFDVFYPHLPPPFFLLTAQILYSFRNVYPLLWPPRYDCVFFFTRSRHFPLKLFCCHPVPRKSRSVREFFDSFSSTSMDLVTISGAECSFVLGHRRRLIVFVTAPLILAIFFLSAYLLAR